MLVLSRKSGQCVMVGDADVRVRAIGRDDVIVTVCGRAQVMRIGDRLRMRDGDVVLVANDGCTCKLGFTHPRSIPIVRAELL